MATTATRAAGQLHRRARGPPRPRDRRARRHEPRHRRGARPRAAVRLAPTSTPPSRAARAALPRVARGQRDRAARASCSSCASGSSRASEDLARSVTTEMGKTLADARAEVARMIEMVECRVRDPDDDAGPRARGRLAQHRRRDDPPAGRRLRRDRAVQLPGDGAVLVPAVRDRVRQHVRAQALRAGPADAADRLRGARRARAAAGRRQPRQRRPRGRRGDPRRTPASTPSRSSARRRSRGSSTSGAAKTGKRVQALGGAKNHMVVMPDAVIDKTVDGIIGSAFGAAGQRCMAGSVVVTVGEAHERLMPALRRGDRGSCRVGDGLDEAIDVGPVVSCAARDRITRLDRPRASTDGATLVGRRPRAPATAPEGSSFVGPTILDDVAPDGADRRRRRSSARCSRSCARTRSTRRSRSSTRSRFGNGTSIFTESGAAVRRYRHEVEAGMIGVNIGVAAPVAFFPFRGWKDIVPRRPARPRPRRGRVLHAQEDRHEPLLLERPGPRLVLRRALMRRTAWNR